MRRTGTFTRMTTAVVHRYHPRGAAKAVLESRAPKVLLSGPAGTGKSRACLEKLHLQCLKYPRIRGLVVRKTQRPPRLPRHVPTETRYPMKQYAKFAVAVVVAGLVALQTALTDGHVTGQEWITIALAAFGALGAPICSPHSRSPPEGS